MIAQPRGWPLCPPAAPRGCCSKRPARSRSHNTECAWLITQQGSHPYPARAGPCRRDLVWPNVGLPNRGPGLVGRAPRRSPIPAAAVQSPISLAVGNRKSPCWRVLVWWGPGYRFGVLPRSDHGTLTAIRTVTVTSGDRGAHETISPHTRSQEDGDFNRSSVHQDAKTGSQSTPVRCVSPTAPTSGMRRAGRSAATTRCLASMIWSLL